MTEQPMIWVIEARALPQFRLWVKFSDSAEGEVDLHELIFSDERPIVAGLQDPKVFSAVRVESDTATWPNGFDLAPEYLYARRTSHRVA